jgi:alanine racemase
VVKADAYGHGLLPVASALAKAGYGTMCVGTVGEAVNLRESGFAGRIVSLVGPVCGDDFEAVPKARVMPFVYEAAQIRELSQIGLSRGEPLPVCVKFDTGMSRLGFYPENANEVVRLLGENPGVAAVAAASHLSCADMPEERGFTMEQAARFKTGLAALRDAGLPLCEASLANSAAAMAYPDLAFDALRPGIAMYGASPFHGTGLDHLGADLKPAMQAVTRLLTVKDLPEGAKVSYGGTFTAPRDMRVAVACLGYADAYSRGLSSKGQVMIHGRRVPILGRVCMQLSILDVTRIPEAAPGDEAWLLGGPGGEAVSIEELAGWWGTITYEALCLLGLSKRMYMG